MKREARSSGEIFIASARARRVLKLLCRMRTFLPRRDHEPNRLANCAMLLVQDATAIRTALADMSELSPTANLALNAVAAPVGPARLDNRSYSNAHAAAFETARSVLNLFETFNFDADRVRDGLSNDAVFFLVTIPGGDDPVEIRRQYEELTARVNQESGAAMEWIARGVERASDVERLSATIIAHGNGCYSIASSPPKRVDENEDCVLQPFLLVPALNLADLEKQSGVSRPNDVLKRLQTKYDGIFAPAIYLPSGKGQGGYHVAIRAVAKPQHPRSIRSALT